MSNLKPTTISSLISEKWTNIHEASGLSTTPTTTRTIGCKPWKSPVKYPIKTSNHDRKESEGNIFIRYSKRMSIGRNMQAGVYLQNQNHLVYENLNVLFQIYITAIKSQ